jgi:hypothetical protein
MLTFKELTERLAPKQRDPLYTARTVMQNAGYVMCFVGSIVNITRSVTQQVDISSASLWQNICQVQSYYGMKLTKIIYHILCAEYILGCFNVPIAIMIKSGG